MSEENNQDNLNGGEGASSSDVKNDVTPETHFKDEKGVPYYNRYREVSEKFKDVDLDLYNRAKDFDLDEAEEALNFKKEVYSDPKKLAKVLEALKGEQQEQRDQGKQNPELSAVIQRMEKLEGLLQSQSQSSWMKQYDSSLESSIAENLKSDFKGLGSLSEFEKKAVMKFVDDAYAADSQSRKPKLSLESLPGVVQGVLKMVQDDRKTRLGGMVKKDESPESLNGGGASGREKPKPMSESERFADMNNFLKNQEFGKVPTQ